MTMPRKVSVLCNNCHHKHEITIYDSINITLDRELKESIITGEIFQVECPECHQKNENVFDVLVHDMEKNLMIKLAHSKEELINSIKFFTSENMGLNDSNNGVQECLNDMKSTYIFRIVQSKEELIEKIYIFDSHKDDRVMEITKLYTMKKIALAYPKMQLQKLSYDNYKGQNQLIGLLKNHDLINTDFDSEMYDYIKNNYGDKLGEITGNDKLIINLL